ncbi:MAG: DnaJ C-terminal domain-containing protein [Microthrixaceae bacterium]
MPTFFTVEVPAGVDDGSTPAADRPRGRGRRGGAAGDLYVRLRVNTDPRFERQGDDLVHRLEVPITQAALGAEVTIDTPDGPETLEIPGGTQPGRLFRLRNKGVPHLNGRGRGDLVVVAEVSVPRSLDDESERLLRELAEAWRGCFPRGTRRAHPREALRRQHGERTVLPDRTSTHNRASAQVLVEDLARPSTGSDGAPPHPRLRIGPDERVSRSTAGAVRVLCSIDADGQLAPLDERRGGRPNGRSRSGSPP